MAKPDFRGNKNPNHRHGLANAGKRHALDICFYNMFSRCYNTKNDKYHRYGGRGIIVCPDWHTKVNFFAWAFMNGWYDGSTIDRKDNDGDYEPSNCHWIGHGANSQKKSTTKLTWNDAEIIRDLCRQGVSEYEVAKIFNVSHGTVWFILKNMTHRF